MDTSLEKGIWKDTWADLRDISGLVPDYCNKVNIAIIMWIIFFGFPVHRKFMFTVYCSLLTMKVIPRSGRSLGVGNGNPLQYSHLQDSVVRGAWQATIYGCKELDMMSTHTQHYVKTANHHLTLQGGHKPSIHQKKKKTTLHICEAW